VAAAVGGYDGGMPDVHQPPSTPTDPDTVEPTPSDDAPTGAVPGGEDAHDELGEIAGGGEITDMGGDSPSS
jgi:hypothetical protein